MCVIQSTALRGKHLQSVPNSDVAEAAKTAKQVAALSREDVLPNVSLAALEAIADWKEAIEGRIECARVRLNLGLPDNDPQLATEVAEFAGECRRLSAEIRDTRRRRAA